MSREPSLLRLQNGAATLEPISRIELLPMLPARG
jgi:hypothetical protein